MWQVTIHTVDKKRTELEIELENNLLEPMKCKNSLGLLMFLVIWTIRQCTVFIGFIVFFAFRNMFSGHNFNYMGDQKGEGNCQIVMVLEETPK